MSNIGAYALVTPFLVDSLLTIEVVQEVGICRVSPKNVLHRLSAGPDDHGHFHAPFGQGFAGFDRDSGIKFTPVIVVPDGVL